MIAIRLATFPKSFFEVKILEQTFCRSLRFGRIWCPGPPNALHVLSRMPGGGFFLLKMEKLAYKFNMKIDLQILTFKNGPSKMDLQKLTFKNWPSKIDPEKVTFKN